VNKQEKYFLNQERSKEMEKPDSEFSFLEGASQSTIQKTLFLGSRKKMADELTLLKKNLQDLVIQKPVGASIKIRQDHIIQRITNLVVFAQSEDQDTKDQIVVALLSYYNIMVTGHYAHHAMLKAFISIFFNWVLKDFLTSEGSFFVFSILESIGSHYSVLGADEKSFLIRKRDELEKCAHYPEDEKVRTQSLRLMEELGLKKKESIRMRFFEPPKEDAEKRASSLPTFHVGKTTVEESVAPRPFSSEAPYALKARPISVETLGAVSLGSFLSFFRYYKKLFLQISLQDSSFTDPLISLLVIEAILRKRIKMEAHKMVIVVDRSAVLPLHMAQYPGVEILDIDPIHRIKSFVDKFQQLINKGFGMIFSLSPDSEFWLSMHYAKDSVEEDDPQIKIINTKTFEMGIGLLAQELVTAITAGYSVPEILERIHHTILRVRYWVVVDSVERVVNKTWYKRMVNKTQEKPKEGAQKPIFAFHQGKGILDYCDTIETAIPKIGSYVISDLSFRKTLPKAVMIKQRGAISFAEHLKQFLLRKYPSLKIDIVSDTEYLNAQLGIHVGIGYL